MCASHTSTDCLEWQELGLWSPREKGSFILDHFSSGIEVLFPFEVWNSKCLNLLIFKAKQKQMNKKERKVYIVIARHKCKSLWQHVSKKFSYHLTTPIHEPYKSCGFFLTSAGSFIYWKPCMSCPGLSTWERGDAHLALRTTVQKGPLS